MTMYMYAQWNLSITDLRIKDTCVMWATIDGPKQLAIETCTYILDFRHLLDWTPLYSVLRTLDPAPNSHIAWLARAPVIGGCGL